MNQLLGEKLSIVTHKPQTTRHRILGILSAPEYQMILSDVPGYVEEVTYHMHRKMNSYIDESFEDADILLVMVSPTDEKVLADQLIQQVDKSDAFKILIINKIDQSTSESVAEVSKEWNEKIKFDNTLEISAEHGTGVGDLLDELVAHLPEGPSYYPKDQISMVGLVKSDANVVVSRTFSKIYGLAGLRLGYVIGRPDLIKKIDKYHMGIANNQPALAAAKASLGDTAFMEYCRKKNAEARKHLTDYLDKKSIWYAKSHTNFLFFPSKTDAAMVLSKLAERGIRIRVWDYKDQQWFRVSIGTLEEMRVFTREFDAFV